MRTSDDEVLQRLPVDDVGVAIVNDNEVDDAGGDTSRSTGDGIVTSALIMAVLLGAVAVILRLWILLLLSASFTDDAVPAAATAAAVVAVGEEV